MFGGFQGSTEVWDTSHGVQGGLGRPEKLRSEPLVSYSNDFSSKKWDVVWEYLVGALQAQRRTRQQLSRVAHSKLSVLSAAVEIQVRMEERASDLLQ